MMTEPIRAGAGVRLHNHPVSEPLAEAVLFAFDHRAFPFHHHAQLHLVPGVSEAVVLPHGPEGAHDEAVYYYGTVLRDGDRFRMWYFGHYGPPSGIGGLRHGSRPGRTLCYAESPDGVAWTKPSLGLVEYRGSKDNNIVLIDDDWRQTGAAVLLDPDDSDPARRYKMAYESNVDGKVCFRVAFSPDGLRWTRHPGAPCGGFLEMCGLVRHGGLYYLNGQDGLTDHTPIPCRKLVTFASKDFVHWSPCAAVGFDRTDDRTGPSRESDWNDREEVHIGAGLWHRGNVIIGIYGQWHGHPTCDRRFVSIDLGLTLSHDALIHHEPIPSFKIVPGREQRDSPADFPNLMQGQGMENVGKHTCFWYSLWKGNEASGVRLVRWERDRLGYLQPFRPTDARAVSCAVSAAGGAALAAGLNVSGLGSHSAVRVNVLDEGFRPLPDYAGANGAVVTESALNAPLTWAGGDTLPTDRGPLRLEVVFEGIRPEDARLHAIYIAARQES